MASDADVESTALHHHIDSLIDAFHLIDKVRLSESLGVKEIIDPIGVLTSSHVRLRGHKWCDEALLLSIENGVKANPERFNNLLAELKRQARVEQAEPDVNQDGKLYLKENARLMKVTRELEQTYRSLGGGGAMGGSVDVVPLPLPPLVVPPGTHTKECGMDTDTKDYSTGSDTKEDQMIRHHFDTLVDTLGKTVDPADFAMRLQAKSLISDDVVQAASVVGVMTGPQRVAPVMEAVLAQIRLNAELFHTFMDVLRRENDMTSAIADLIQPCGPDAPISEIGSPPSPPLDSTPSSIHHMESEDSIAAGSSQTEIKEYGTKYKAAKYISREHWHAAHIAFKNFCDRVESLQECQGIKIKNNGMCVAVRMTRDKTYLPEPAICLAVDDEEEFKKSMEKDGVWAKLMNSVAGPEKDGGPIDIQVQLVQFGFQLVPTARPGSVISRIKEGGGECITTVTVSIKLNDILHVVTVGHLVVDRPKGCFEVKVDDQILVDVKKDLAGGYDIALFQHPDIVASAERPPKIIKYKAEAEKNPGDPGDPFPIHCVYIADELTLLCRDNREYKAIVSEYPCKGPAGDGIDYNHAMALDLKGDNETQLGDSGAAVVNNKGELVGIVIGKTTGGKSIAFPIERGFNALRIDTVTEHGSTYLLSDLRYSSAG